MESLEPVAPAGRPDEAVAGAAEWAEITRLVSASIPADAPEAWLGQLVFEAQLASDRAAAWARGRADSMVAEAQAEADDIRQHGRRRAQVMSRFEAVRHQVTERQPGGTTQSVPMPPAPRPAPRMPAPPRPAPAPVNRDRPAPPAAAAPGTQPPFPNPDADARAPRNGPAPRREAAPRRDTTTAAVVPVPLRPPAPAAALATGPNPAIAPARRGGIDLRALLVLVAIVVAALGLVVFERYGTAASERSSQHHLAAEFARLEARRSPVAAPASGGALGLLSLPRLGIGGQAVVEGLTLAHLREGPAHDSSSQLPGQRGAVLIVGHRQAYGGPFAGLGNVRIGDVISLRTTAGLYVYRVSRAPHVLRPGPGATLALPSADEVRASGGNADHADQALVLATGIGPRDAQLRVVVAILEQASTVPGAALPPSTGGSAVLHSVPGQRVGLVWACFWLLAVSLFVAAARRLKHRLPPAGRYPLASVLVVVAIYQAYAGLDRLVPGTS